MENGKSSREKNETTYVKNKTRNNQTPQQTKPCVRAEEDKAACTENQEEECCLSITEW